MSEKYAFDKMITRLNRYQKFLDSCYALDNSESERIYNQLLVEHNLPLETWIPMEQMLPDDEEIVKSNVARLQNEFLPEEEVEAIVHLLDSIYDLDYTYIIAGVPLATANQEAILGELEAYSQRKK